MKEVEIEFCPTIKQDLIFEYFDDEETTEIVWGGAAGGGKSYGLCALMILKCLEHPGIRVGLARDELSKLKKTTMSSFFEVCSDFGMLAGEHFTYNSTGGIVKFYNDSEIVLVELTSRPNDPEFTRLGGLLFTFGCIDEVNEIEEKAFHHFNSRIGRWKNDDTGIKPIVITTCNPSKNWVYREFFKADREGSLKHYRRFVQALVHDNPHIPESYIENLKRKPMADRERLLYGNWDYDSNPNDLMTHQDILNIWDGAKKHDGKKYITADIAFTSDKMVIMIWDDLTIIDIIVNPPGKIEEVIKTLADQHNVPHYNIAFDSDGVGKFLTQRLRNAKAIVNNARALKDENYKNLKTQLYFKLAEKVNDNRVKCIPDDHKSEMIEELQVVRHKPTNKVGKLEMVDKGEVKKMLGRSPDFSDAMAYRMRFEYGSAGKKTFSII